MYSISEHKQEGLSKWTRYQNVLNFFYTLYTSTESNYSSDWSIPDTLRNLRMTAYYMYFVVGSLMTIFRNKLRKEWNTLYLTNYPSIQSSGILNTCIFWYFRNNEHKKKTAPGAIEITIWVVRDLSSLVIITRYLICLIYVPK